MVNARDGGIVLILVAEPVLSPSSSACTKPAVGHDGMRTDRRAEAFGNRAKATSRPGSAQRFAAACRRIRRATDRNPCRADAFSCAVVNFAVPDRGGFRKDLTVGLASNDRRAAFSVQRQPGGDGPPVGCFPAARPAPARKNTAVLPERAGTWAQKAPRTHGTRQIRPKGPARRPPPAQIGRWSRKQQRTDAEARRAARLAHRAAETDTNQRQRRSRR